MFAVALLPRRSRLQLPTVGQLLASSPISSFQTTIILQRKRRTNRPQASSCWLLPLLLGLNDYTMRSSSLAYTSVWLMSSMCCAPASSSAAALWKWMVPAVTVQPRCAGRRATAAAQWVGHSPLRRTLTAATTHPSPCKFAAAAHCQLRIGVKPPTRAHI